MVAIYLSRQLGGHKQGEIGRAVGLEKASSVSSAFLRTKSRVAQEKNFARRVRRIEAALLKSKKRTCRLMGDPFGSDPFGSPTCIKFTSSFGIDAKLFIRIASVYPDRCKQSLQYSPVVARLDWVLDRS